MIGDYHIQDTRCIRVEFVFLFSISVFNLFTSTLIFYIVKLFFFFFNYLIYNFAKNFSFTRLNEELFVYYVLI